MHFVIIVEIFFIMYQVCDLCTTSPPNWDNSISRRKLAAVEEDLYQCFRGVEHWKQSFDVRGQNVERDLLECNAQIQTWKLRAGEKEVTLNAIITDQTEVIHQLKSQIDMLNGNLTVCQEELKTAKVSLSEKVDH